MKKGSFQYHLEALYGSVERALRLNPMLRAVDVKRGKRPNAIITKDGDLRLINRDGRFIVIP